jgi:hypothetical protein
MKKRINTTFPRRSARVSGPPWTHFPGAFAGHSGTGFPRMERLAARTMEAITAIPSYSVRVMSVRNM